MNILITLLVTLIAILFALITITPLLVSGAGDDSLVILPE